MIALGSVAPDFNLPDTVSGKSLGLADFAAAPALLVLFICNHCPYVKHIAPALAALGQEYQAKGLAIVAISANDAANYPDDDPEKMRETAAQLGYTFPYLYDATQAVAHAYQAVCTPDFFLYDAARTLVYRGQFDASRPSSGIPVTGADLRAACDAVLAGQPVSSEQQPSLGCNIKWIAGNEPAC
jgi:peroxiredoxin